MTCGDAKTLWSLCRIGVRIQLGCETNMANNRQVSPWRVLKLWPRGSFDATADIKISKKQRTQDLIGSVKQETETEMEGRMEAGQNHLALTLKLNRPIRIYGQSKKCLPRLISICSKLLITITMATRKKRKNQMKIASRPTSGYRHKMHLGDNV